MKQGQGHRGSWGAARGCGWRGGGRARTACPSGGARERPRRAGPVELWQLDELTHRRALQVARAAENEVLKAAQGEAAARDGYVAAHQDKEGVQRAQERKRAGILSEMGRLRGGA